MGSLAASHQLRGTVKTHLMESLSHIDFSWRYSHHAWYPTLSSSGPISSHSPLPAPRLAPPCVRSSVRPSPFSSYLKKKGNKWLLFNEAGESPINLNVFLRVASLVRVLLGWHFIKEMHWHAQDAVRCRASRRCSAVSMCALMCHTLHRPPSCTQAASAQGLLALTVLKVNHVGSFSSPPSLTACSRGICEALFV